MVLMRTANCSAETWGVLDDPSFLLLLVDEEYDDDDMMVVENILDLVVCLGDREI